MFKKISRVLFKNPFDRMLEKTAKKGGAKILIAWNRGLGDIALGLYAMVHRIQEKIPNAEITFVTRENLRDGFSMLEGVQVVVAPWWERGVKNKILDTLQQLQIDPSHFDLIIEAPSPTDWVRWQIGRLMPRLFWDVKHDLLWKSFDLSEETNYIAVQPEGDIAYGAWRSWPEWRWRKLFDLIGKIPNTKILLFGFRSQMTFSDPNVIDLRGKTSLFELFSILKNRCRAAILPDSGILSLLYYLDVSFPIHVISLWSDPGQGVLKQAVSSPNPKLIHSPLIGVFRDLSTISEWKIFRTLFPAKPLQRCVHAKEISPKLPTRVGVVLLAGGQGSRLGHLGPKGTFPLQGKSLFQWICEKVSLKTPIAVMTSPMNHEETVLFFKKHRFFLRRVEFFQQSLHPTLDEKRRPTKFLAPDGNGSFFQSFVQSGLAKSFEEEGIDLLSIVPVENVLADPVDPLFLTHVRESSVEAAVKCIEREAADPPMGALMERDGKLEILEYTEQTPSFHYRYAYVGMMAFQLSFVKRVAKEELPLHWVWKKMEGRFGWKGERFIFDSLHFAQKTAALCYLRDQIYAPLKIPENINKILNNKTFNLMLKNGRMV